MVLPKMNNFRSQVAAIAGQSGSTEPVVMASYCPWVKKFGS